MERERERETALPAVHTPRLGDRVGMVVVEGEPVCAVLEQRPAPKADRPGLEHDGSDQGAIKWKEA